MPRFESMLNSIGTLLAVIVSLGALSHTIRSNQQLRSCEFLYSQSERLIELKKAINRDNTVLERMETDVESVIEENDDNDSQIEAALDRYLARLLTSSREIHLTFELYQYVFLEKDLETIGTKISEIEDIQRQFKSSTISQVDYFVGILLKGKDLFDLLTCVSDRELREVSRKLRKTCK